MIIRTAGIQDITDIRTIAAETWPVAYKAILSQAQLAYMLQKFYSDDALKEQLLTKGHQFYLIADKNKNNVGFASVSKEEEATFKLQKLYVLPGQQGNNLGKQLLDKVILFCEEQGGKRLVLNVNRFNKARTFYEKQGFKIVQEIDIAIGNDYFMNDFIMERNL